MKKIIKNILIIIVLAISFAGIANAGTISDAPRISEVLLSVLKFLLYISGALAIIMLVASGVMYVVSFGNERSTEKAKDGVKYSIIGLMIALFGLAIVRTITLIIGE